VYSLALKTLDSSVTNLFIGFTYTLVKKDGGVVHGKHFQPSLKNECRGGAHLSGALYGISGVDLIKLLCANLLTLRTTSLHNRDK
jgi:hypothetical protein